MKVKTVNTVIVATHDSLSPVRGGGALRTLSVIRELNNRGFKVIAVAPFDRETSGESGVLYIPVPQPRKARSQILSALKFNLRLARRLLPILGKADVFFAHNTIACIWVPFFKIIFRRFRFVLDITDIHAEYLPVGKRNIIEIAVTPFLLWYEYLIIKSADRITVATHSMCQRLISKGAKQDKVQVVYDSVEKGEIPNKKELTAAEGIIHLGAIDRQHNVEVLIQAIPAVIARFPRARFFIVGGGREMEAVKELALKLGVEGNCCFTGSLDYEQAREYLKNAAIGVITRKDCLANRIVTTQKLFEYWASCTAVISTELAGVSEIAKDGRDVLWFRSADAADLAEKIKLLLGDGEYRNRLAAAAFSRADEFNRKSSAEKIVAFVTGS